MSEENKFRMINVQIQASHRSALKLLKKKYKVTTMDDVVGILLSRHEKEAYENGLKMATMQREMEDMFDDEDE